MLRGWRLEESKSAECRKGSFLWAKLHTTDDCKFHCSPTEVSRTLGTSLVVSFSLEPARVKMKCRAVIFAREFPLNVDAKEAPKNSIFSRPFKAFLVRNKNRTRRLAAQRRREVPTFPIGCGDSSKFSLELHFRRGQTHTSESNGLSDCRNLHKCSFLHILGKKFLEAECPTAGIRTFVLFARPISYLSPSKNS